MGNKNRRNLLTAPLGGQLIILTEVIICLSMKMEAICLSAEQAANIARRVTECVD